MKSPLTSSSSSSDSPYLGSRSGEITGTPTKLDITTNTDTNATPKISDISNTPTINTNTNTDANANTNTNNGTNTDTNTDTVDDYPKNPLVTPSKKADESWSFSNIIASL